MRKPADRDVRDEGKMTERDTMDVLPPPGDGEGMSDDEPGPSPASVVILHDAWRETPGAALTVHEAVNAATRFVPALAEGEIAIALSSDTAVRDLNARFRGQDKPTNVLSFPAAGFAGAEDVPSGDIIIAYETLVREAASEEKYLNHHLAHLTVHGLLHLAGYDHDSDADAEEMEALERRILATLDIPDPYRSEIEKHQSLAG
jgi:probable rRNA maturation factor